MSKKNKIVPLVFNKPEKNYNNNNTCSICINKINNKESYLPCGHVFHSDCILNWMEYKMNCPICRIPLIWHIDKN
jgi:hypothetical protein